MAESLQQFVSRRQQAWQQLDRLLELLLAKKLSLEQLESVDRHYRQASADLARAQSFFPNTDVHRYLNQLCAKGYGALYRQKPHRLEGLKTFFARDFPRTVRAELVYVAAAAALMILGMIIGAVTVALEPSGVELFVPEHLRDGVRAGKLWTDSLEGHTASSALAVDILTNNLSVAFRAFAFGLSFGLGTIAVLLGNGIHIGALLTFTFQNGVGLGLLEFMAAHGFVELTIIALAGAAGLILGHALIDPGERPRSEVLSERARVAVKLVLGGAPFMALIGVIEGFISPGALFPAAVKVVLGAALGLALWGYFLRAAR